MAELSFSVDGGDRFAHDDPPVLATAGAKTVAVFYTDSSNNAHSDTVAINVTRTAISGVSILTPPSKVQYTVGDTFSLEGLALLRHFNNPRTAATVLAWSAGAGIGSDIQPDMSSPGVYNLRFTYEGFATPTYVAITVNRAPPAVVSFDTGIGSDAVIPSQFIDIGERVARIPAAPTAKPYPFAGAGLFVGGDYVFEGWFAFGENAPFAFEDRRITESMALTARWAAPGRVENLVPNFTTNPTNTLDGATATPGVNNSVQLRSVIAHVNANAGTDFVLVVDAPNAAANVVFLRGFENLTGATNHTITGSLELRGASGRPVQRFRLSTNGYMFNIGTGGSLTLGDGITLQGRHDSASTVSNVSTLPRRADNNRPLIRTGDGGLFVMRDGSMLQGNRSTNSTAVPGAGVHIAGGGTFVMHGGALDSLGFSDGVGNNTSTGGAVHIASGGLFEMRGGEMTRNRASLGAWGPTIANEGGVFRISGGWIPGTERVGSGTDNIGNSTSTAGRGGVLRHRSAVSGAISEWGTFDEDGAFTSNGVFANGTVLNRDAGILIVNGQQRTPPANGRP